MDKKPDQDKAATKRIMKATGKSAEESKEIARRERGIESRGMAGEAARRMAEKGGYKLGGTKPENKGKKTPADYYNRKGR